MRFTLNPGPSSKVMKLPHGRRSTGNELSSLAAFSIHTTFARDKYRISAVAAAMLPFVSGCRQHKIVEASCFDWLGTAGPNRATVAPALERSPFFREWWSYPAFVDR